MASNNQSETTHIRAHKPAPRRINKLGKKLAADRGGKWPQPEVIDQALDALEEKLFPQAKPAAQ